MPSSHGTKPRADGRPVRSARRRWIGRGIALAIVPTLLLAAELGLRLAGFGYPTDYFLHEERGDFYGRNHRFGWRFFPRSMATVPEVFRLPAEKAPGVTRIFVLGGSAALGTPDTAYSFARYLEAMLVQLYPDERFEVVNTAMAAINSHVVLEIAEECARRRPDHMVVYLGNNEVIGPFGAGTVFTGFSKNRASIRAGLALKSTKLGQLYEELLAPDKRFEPWRGMEMFEDPVRRGDSRLEVVYEHLRENLADICGIGRDAGAQVFLSTVGVNLADSPPFASAAAPEHLGTVMLEGLIAKGASLADGGDHEAALAAFQEALGLHPASAELWFRKGRALLELGHVDRARQAFAEARDLDTLRFRADSRTNDTIRGVAREEDCVLVDAEEAFAAASPNGIPGDELFLEHVHMSPLGNWVAARAVLAELEPRLELSSARARPQGPSGVPSFEECSRWLGLTAWDENRHRQTILQMTRRPPFVGQIGHQERVRLLQNRVASFGRERGPAAVASALDVYRALLAERPDDWHLLISFASLCAEGGSFEEGIAAFERLIELFPREPVFLEGASRLLRAAGREEESLAHLEQALALDPADVDVNVALGNTLHASRRSDEALERYAAALERGDSYAAHTSIALIRSQRGEYDAALRHLERALELSPDFVPALSLAAVVEAERPGGDLERAIVCAERASVLSSHRDDNLLEAWAGLLVQVGRPAEAAEVVGRQVELMRSYGRERRARDLEAARAALEAEGRRADLGRQSSRLVRQLGRQLKIEPQEIERILGLSVPERLAEVDRLVRDFVERRVRRSGLPAGLERAEWESWSELSDADFLERARARGLVPEGGLGATGGPGADSD